MQTRNFHKTMMLLLMLILSVAGHAQTKIDGFGMSSTKERRRLRWLLQKMDYTPVRWLSLRL